MIYVTMKEAVEIAKDFLGPCKAGADWLMNLTDGVDKFRAVSACVSQKIRYGEDLCFLFESDEEALLAGKLFEPTCRWHDEFMDITAMVSCATQKVFINSRGAVESYTAGTVFWRKLSELVGDVLSSFPKEMHSDLLMQMQDACSVYGTTYKKFLKERWQS